LKQHCGILEEGLQLWPSSVQTDPDETSAEILLAMVNREKSALRTLWVASPGIWWGVNKLSEIYRNKITRSAGKN
jgi:hypothetical protein